MLGWHRYHASQVAAIEPTLGCSNLHSLGPERREAAQYLADQDPEAPYIGFVAVSGANEHFWGGVGWSTAVGASPVSLQITQLFRKAKVYQFDVSPSIQKDILWLQISVNYVVLMELLNCNQDFGQVEPRVFQGQASLLFNLREELSSWQVLQQQVQILIVLHRLKEVNEETTIS